MSFFMFFVIGNRISSEVVNKLILLYDWFFRDISDSMENHENFDDNFFEGIKKLRNNEYHHSDISLGSKDINEKPFGWEIHLLKLRPAQVVECKKNRNFKKILSIFRFLQMERSIVTINTVFFIIYQIFLFQF